MLLVVLGHTMSGVVLEYSDSFLYQVIWTLQMPLFMIISGYVTRYSRRLTNVRTYGEFIAKRTMAYLLPWIIWTIVVRGIINGEDDYLNLIYVVRHMDSGYWFLFVLWSISMIFGLADLLSNKLTKDGTSQSTWNILSHILILGVGGAVLATIGFFWGFDLCAIKLTIYYLPFYSLGYLYGKIQEYIFTAPKGKTIVDFLAAVSFVIWVLLISRLDFFAMSDDLAGIACRFCASILGCNATICLLVHMGQVNRISEILEWTGVHSLEIYLTHYLFLCLAPPLVCPVLASINGILSLCVNFLLTMILTYLIINVVQRNKYLNFLLFAKKNYNRK